MGRTGSRTVQISFSAGKLTHFGGVFLLHSFLQKLFLRTFLSESIRIQERNNYFSISERLFALLYPMILGLNTIELSTLLGANGVFQYLTGLPRFPKPNTLRRFLTDKTEVLLPRLRSAHNQLRSRFMILPQTYSSYCLDFDSTAKTLYGHQEGVVKGYNPGHRGKKSYHPLVCTEARLKDCLGGSLRYGNAHTADGVLPMLDTALQTLPAAAREIRARADAGFYDKAFISRLSEKQIGFTVVAHMTAPLKNRLPGLRYHRVNKILSTSELKYQPHGWKQKYRFVVLREKLSEERKEQLTLFTSNAYSYHVIVTNLDLTPYGVFSFYRDRTGLERIIRSLKEDYPFAKAVTGSFAANSLYAELSLLAYNIVIWFKRLCLPEDWQSYTAGTLRQRLLLIPGIFTRTDNRPVLKLPKSSPYQETFLYAQKQISKLRSLVE
jgi:hypothetical protein